MSTHSGYTGSVTISLTAPDHYTAASTIEGVMLDRINLDVLNQAIYWQLKLGFGAGSGNWEAAEKKMTPGSRTISRPGITGIRVRAAVPAAQLPPGFPQAIVDVEAVT